MSQTAYHVVVERDRAKTLFAAARNPDELLDFVDQLVSDTNCQRLEIGDQWQALHDQLAAVQDDSPLQHAILGGRPLNADPQRPIILVRPDIVPAVADAIEALEWSDGNPIIEIGKIFRAAANAKAAMMFAVVDAPH